MMALTLSTTISFADSLSCLSGILSFPSTSLSMIGIETILNDNSHRLKFAISILLSTFSALLLSLCILLSTAHSTSTSHMPPLPPIPSASTTSTSTSSDSHTSPPSISCYPHSPSPSSIWSVPFNTKELIFHSNFLTTGCYTSNHRSSIYMSSSASTIAIAN